MWMQRVFLRHGYALRGEHSENHQALVLGQPKGNIRRGHLVCVRELGPHDVPRSVRDAAAYPRVFGSRG